MSTTSKPTTAQTTAANTKKENAEKENKLSEAKDRAQLTATTAMSVVHVALLRTLINGGPSTNRYYYVVLTLIILSLALQVLAGLVSLLIAHMKSYYQKHHEDVCSELVDNLCCCGLRYANVEEKYAVEEFSTGIRNPAFAEVVPNVYHATDMVNRANSTSKRKKKNSKWRCSVQVMTDDDAKLEKNVHDFTQATLESDIKVAEAEVELEYLKTLCENTRREKEKLGAQHQDVTDGPSHIHDVDHCDNVLKQCEHNIHLYNQMKRNNAILHQQEDILMEHYEESKKKFILKKVAFWQHLLNYMLYIVFIFNTFITGFGVTPTDQNAMGNVTAI